MTQKRQYGLWDSALHEQMLAGEKRLSDVQFAGDGETLVWLQKRDGRGVLVVRRPGEPPRPINDRLSAGGGVGYGGGAFCVHGDDVFFAADDGRLYRAKLDRGTPEPITPEWGEVASPAVSPDGRWVAFVHHHGDEDRLALVDTGGETWPVIAAKGGDFYMQPNWHPDGNRLVWVRWDHPNMPWNGTVVETAPLEVAGGQPVVGDCHQIAGADDVACQQPSFSPDGKQLAYLSDESGDWQLYVRDTESGEQRRISIDGRQYAGPAWIQGLRFYQWAPDGEAVVAVSAKEGFSHIDWIDVISGESSRAGFEAYTAISQPAVGAGGDVAAIGSASSIPPRVVMHDADVGADRIEAFASSERLGEQELADVRPVSWPADDDGPIETVHGLYYPPTNPEFDAEGKPPAIVMIHGGPTSQRVATWEPRNQYFATRGWAVLDVNYRGSTGYGREYMEALFGRWGLVDVHDAVGAAEFLVDESLAADGRLAIMGGSAGGYTVLQSLVCHPGVFRAGVAMYGVSNLFELARDTHKFEQYYCDTLVGPLPEASDKYRECSPLFSADQIEDALALYHGANDKVVPLEQTEKIVESLQRRGIPHLHHVYEEEGHGWRRADTVEHFHRSVLDFLVEHVVYG